MNRRTSIKRVSDKKRAKDAARRVCVEIVRRRAHDRCEAADAVREVACRGPMDPHEIIPRSAWRDGDLDPENVRWVCRAHHDWIGDHPAEAHGYGLHGYSWERP